MDPRPARPSDAEAVATIRIAGWQTYAGILDAGYVASETFASEARRSAAAWFATVDEDGRTPAGGTTLVHERDGRVDGWVSFGRDRDVDDAAAGEVWGLYVAPDSWGSGTARRLLDGATSALHREGFRDLVLWCLDGNGRALAFYETSGWRLDGTRRTRDFGAAGTADEVSLRPIAPPA